MARTNVMCGYASANHYNQAGSNSPIQTPGGTGYFVYIDADSDVVFRKSPDGLDWSAPTVLFTGTAVSLSTCYDRLSGINAGLIHVAYAESGTDDVKYRSIDTENSDALSSQTVIFAGLSTGFSGGALSIARARGGNLGCVFNIDGGTEDGFARSTDVGATWGAAADPTEAASGDQYFLLPGWAADNQDLMLVFWDTSASEISLKLFDNSGDSWSEASIATSMTAPAAATNFPHLAVSVDLANSQNVMAAWSNIDAAGAKLRCWTLTEAAIVEVTNVVSSSTDDQGFCAVGIDTVSGDWTVYYAGATDGSETMTTSVNIYSKTSADDGTTWGAETAVTEIKRALNAVYAAQRFADANAICHFVGTQVALMSVEIPSAGGGGLATPLFGNGVVA